MRTVRNNSGVFCIVFAVYAGYCVVTVAVIYSAKIRAVSKFAVIYGVLFYRVVESDKSCFLSFFLSFYSAHSNSLRM